MPLPRMERNPGAARVAGAPTGSIGFTDGTACP
jgi:hypothetical protein